jgi:hypothetical protein
MTGNKTNEPLFLAVRRNDPDLGRAHGLAAASIDIFRGHVDRPGAHTCWAKLRFRDPDLSAELGEDQFLFLWLSEAQFHPQDGLFSAEFFEVPEDFTKWHKVGDRLAFAPEDIFDWAVNDNGTMLGAYTMRVTRSRLPEHKRADFDRNLGVQRWAPV